CDGADATGDSSADRPLVDLGLKDVDSGARTRLLAAERDDLGAELLGARTALVVARVLRRGEPVGLEGLRRRRSLLPIGGRARAEPFDVGDRSRPRECLGAPRLFFFLRGRRHLGFVESARLIERGDRRDAIARESALERFLPTLER